MSRWMSLLRGFVFLAISAVLSWHFLLRQTDEAPAEPTEVEVPTELAVAPAVLPPQGENEQPAEEPPPAPAAEEQPQPKPPAPQEAASEPTPPPAERGNPDGEEEEENQNEVVEEEEPVESRPERVRREISEIQSSPEKIEEAAAEVSGRTRRGFRTVFYSSAEDQLAIARFFGEPVVLVPRKGLDPRNHFYYRVDGASFDKIVRVNEKPPTNRFRQYRDLSSYEYAELPGMMRALRRRVPVRSDIYLFASLIPPSEWAVVIARRQAALATCQQQLSGARSLQDLRRVEMRYVPLSGGGFDIEVKQLVFADGTRWKNQP